MRITFRIDGAVRYDTLQQPYETAAVFFIKYKMHCHVPCVLIYPTEREGNDVNAKDVCWFCSQSIVFSICNRDVAYILVVDLQFMYMLIKADVYTDRSYLLSATGGEERNAPAVVARCSCLGNFKQRSQFNIKKRLQAQL